MNNLGTLKLDFKQKLANSKIRPSQIQYILHSYNDKDKLVCNISDYTKIDPLCLKKPTIDVKQLDVDSIENQLLSKKLNIGSDNLMNNSASHFFGCSYHCQQPSSPPFLNISSDECKLEYEESLNNKESLARSLTTRMEIKNLVDIPNSEISSDLPQLIPDSDQELPSILANTSTQPSNQSLFDNDSNQPQSIKSSSSCIVIMSDDVLETMNTMVDYSNMNASWKGNVITSSLDHIIGFD